ncbi:hypothetical protein PQX77_010004 [Marasmius sp. AFHP31]|nr:hypothetical protein PQX77_010004 [Marasmius sp. AFHP31]
MQNAVVQSPTTYNMVSTLSSPSAIAPDDHVEVFLEILFEFGFELVDIDNLLSNPGFENILYSTSFKQLLRRFPPNTLSDFSLSMLVHVVTDETVLEVLADEELVPSFVDLLANRLGKVVGLEMDNIPVPSRQLSSSSNSMVPTQSAPQTNTVPTYSAEIHSASSSTGSGIDLNSVFNSQQTSRYTTHHMVTSSGLLAPNKTPPIYSTIPHGKDPVIRPHPAAVKSNYKPDVGASQRSPKSGIQPNALDSRNYVSGGKSQHGNHERGTLLYLQRAPHATVKPTLFPSASIPEQSAIPSLQTPHYSPRSIKGSAFLAVEGIPDLASPTNENHEETCHNWFEDAMDTERSHSVIRSNSGFNLQNAPQRTIGNVLLPSQPILSNRSKSISSASAHSDNVVNCSQSKGGPVVPRKSYMQQTRTSLIPTTMRSQLETPSSTLPAWSALLSIDGPSIPPGSAISSQVPGCPISHVPRPFSPIQTSVRAEQPTSDWWDQDGSSDSLFSSDAEGEDNYLVDPEEAYNEDDHYSRGLEISPEHSPYTEFPEFADNVDYFNDLSDLYEDEETYGFGDQYEHDEPEGNFYHEVGTVEYDDDSASQCFEECGIPPDDSHCTEFDGVADNADGYDDSRDLHEDGENYDFGHQYDHEDPKDDPHVQIGDIGYNDDATSQHSDEPQIPLKDSTHLEVDEQWDAVLSGEEYVGYNDGASRCSDELGIPHNEEETTYDPEDPCEIDQPLSDDDGTSQGSDGRLYSNGGNQLDSDEEDAIYLYDEAAEFSDSQVLDEPYDDGASQRSDDWGIPPDNQSEQGYESPCENDGFEEDKTDQYEYGDERNPDEYLVLIPQSFPCALWSFQLPKDTHLPPSPKEGISYESKTMFPFRTTLFDTLSSHLPFFIILAVFEPLLRSIKAMFLQNLQLSRHFVSPLEGTDIIVNYREHLLLPEDDESDSEFLDEEIEVTHDAMDDLFGHSGSDEISSYDANESEDGINKCPNEPGVPYGNEDQGEPDERNEDSSSYIADWYQYGCGDDQSPSEYLALTSQNFPQSLWLLQSPKTEEFDWSTLPYSLTTTFLYPYPGHTSVLTTLASLERTLQLFGTAWAQRPPSFRENWVGMLDEKAVMNAASKQHLKRSSINGRIVPVYLATDHDLLNSLEATGSYVYHTHNDNLEPTSSPEILQTQQSSTVPVSRLSTCFLALVNISVKLRHKRLGRSDKETASGQRHQWHIPVVSSVPSFVGTELFREVAFVRNVLQNLPQFTGVLKQAAANEPWDYLVVFGTFEPFLRVTIVVFLQSPRLSYHFVSSIEGTSSVSNHREYVLWPKEGDSESGISTRGIEVTYDTVDEPFDIGSFNHHDKPFEEVINGTVLNALQSLEFEFSRGQPQLNTISFFLANTAPMHSSGVRCHPLLLNPKPASAIFPDSLRPIEMLVQRIDSPRPTLRALYSRRDGSREQKGTRGRHSESVRLLTPINARYAGCSPSILIQQPLRRENRRLKGGVKTLPMSSFAAHFLLVTTFLPLLFCSDFDFWNHSKAQQKFPGNEGPMLDQTYAPYLSRPRFALVSLLLTLSVVDFHGQITTSRVFKKGSPQPGYNCSPHSSPHSQPSSLSFRDLRPHNGLHSNILHPASTGVSKNDLPCSLRVFQPLRDCSLPPLSHSHVKPPPHLSLTRLGAAKALGKLVFGAELMNWARPNGAVTQSKQHREDKEKHISIHVILESGVLDHLDRRHSVPREAAKIAPVSAQALCYSPIAHIICVQQKLNYRMGALYPLLHTLDPKDLEAPSLQQSQSPLILSSLTSRSLVPRSQLSNARSVGSSRRWYPHLRYCDLSNYHQLAPPAGILNDDPPQLVHTQTYPNHSHFSTVTARCQRMIVRCILLFNQIPFSLTPSWFTLLLTHNGCPIASDSPYSYYRPSVLDTILIHECPDISLFLPFCTPHQPDVVQASDAIIQIEFVLFSRGTSRQGSQHQIRYILVLTQIPSVVSAVSIQLNEYSESSMVLSNSLSVPVSNPRVTLWSNDTPFPVTYIPNITCSITVSFSTKLHISIIQSNAARTLQTFTIKPTEWTFSNARNGGGTFPSTFGSSHFSLVTPSRQMTSYIQHPSGVWSLTSPGSTEVSNRVSNNLWKESVKQDAPETSNPPNYPRLIQLSPPGNSLSPNFSSVDAVVSIGFMHTPIGLGFFHSCWKSSPPTNLAVAYNGQLGDSQGDKNIPCSAEVLSGPLTSSNARPVQYGSISLLEAGQYGKWEEEVGRDC